MKKTINYGSFNFVRIVGVKKEITFKTLSLSPIIIVPMNANSNTFNDLNIGVGYHSNVI